MLIIGAGMSGLIAANMLRKQSPIILEKQEKLPNNHHALLRFRSDVVSEVTGIPFKKVKVLKQINDNGEHKDSCSIKISNIYSKKVSGKYSGRSISNLLPSERFIAPPDFISKLSIGLDIRYNSEVNLNVVDKKEPIISTIPMYNLMKLLDWSEIPNFDYVEIWSITLDIKSTFCDVYQTTYYPNPDLDFYRSSITGNKVIFEFINKPRDFYNYKDSKITLFQLIDHFVNRDYGIHLDSVDISSMEISHQKYGKLIDVNENIRKRFIRWATEKYNIYSLGRWGTHRQILMDDVVNDVKVIDKIIKTNRYGR